MTSQLTVHSQGREEKPQRVREESQGREERGGPHGSAGRLRGFCATLASLVLAWVDRGPGFQLHQDPGELRLREETSLCQASDVSRAFSLPPG